MKVWVVMRNDYPNAVFATSKAADAYCALKKEEPTSNHASGGIRIYWRIYKFEVRS